MKSFLIKDLSGREFTSTNLPLNVLLEWEDETDDDDNPLHEWANNSSVGDQWRIASMLITCINS